MHLWASEFWQDSKEDIFLAQEELARQGAAGLVLCLVDYRRAGREVLSASFLAGVALLLGGNPRVQHEFTLLFKRRPAILSALSQLEARLVQQLLHCQEYAMGEAELQATGFVLLKLYRFLQLLSENNNNEMKKFLFCQGCSGSVNFVSQAVTTLGKVGTIPKVETRVPNLL